MTPAPSSQTNDPRHISVDDGWTGRARTLVRRRTLALIETDPHFRELKPSAQRLVTILVAFHVPATGRTQIRTLNDELLKRCRCSVSTLKRARHEAIEAGFIVGYVPGGGNPGRGTGGRAGDYMIARSPEEAATARALRAERAAEVAEIERERELDPECTRQPSVPYWPAFLEREAKAMPEIRETRGRPSKAAQEARAKPQQAAPEIAPTEAEQKPVTWDEQQAINAQGRAETRALLSAMRKGAADEATARRQKVGHTDAGRAAAEAELRARQQREAS